MGQKSLLSLLIYCFYMLDVNKFKKQEENETPHADEKSLQQSDDSELKMS